MFPVVEPNWVLVSLAALLLGLVLFVTGDVLWAHQSDDWVPDEALLGVPAMCMIFAAAGLVGGGLGYLAVQALHAAIPVIWAV
jgi:hypothetical protein